GQASGLRSFFIRIRRYSDSAKARGDVAESHLPLRRPETRRRVVYELFLSRIPPGDSLAALLQYLWTISGSHLAVLGRAGTIRHANAGWEALHNLRRRRAEPRLYLCGECRQRESACM